MKHTKEPWYGEYNIADEEGPLDEPEFSGEILADFDDCGITPVICHGVSEVNANRIVACVNACKGLTNEVLDKGILEDAIALVLNAGKDIGVTWDDVTPYYEGVKVWEEEE